METAGSRREFLRAIGLGAAAMAWGRWASAAPKARPNVVFIMADDLGYGDLGCYGATKVKTPHIDRVARQGVRFTDAHTPSAVCSPTRYGVLTGRYPWRAGVYTHLQPNDSLRIRTDELTVGKLFQSEGYATGCVGKWHLGIGAKGKGPDWNGALTPGPLEVGFHYYFGVPTSNNYPPFVYVEDHRVVGLKPGETLKVTGHRDNQKVPTRKHEDIAITQTAKAVAFIERHRGKPFFLYFPTCNVHKPHTPNQRFRGTSGSGIYGDFIQEYDWTVGEIVKTLDRLGLADNTLLIVTSDNGATNSGIHGHRSCGALHGWKAQVWEGGHRVPFVARWPGRIQPGTTCDETTCHTDLLATAAAILGRTLPEGAGPDSFNILPALLGHTRDKPIRDATIHVSQSAADRAIRMGPWKLIFFRNGTQHLYNLHDDLGETKNLAANRPDVVKRLTAKYDELGARDPRKLARRAPSRDGLDGKGVDKTGEFKLVRNGQIAKHAMGYELRAGTDGHALRQLPEPITTSATFELRYKAATAGHIRNGFFCFGDKPDLAGLVKCGSHIRAGRHTISQGPYTSLDATTHAVAARLDPDATFAATVAVDLKRRTIELTVDGAKVKAPLPKDIQAIRTIGYYAYRTHTAFSAITCK